MKSKRFDVNSVTTRTSKRRSIEAVSVEVVRVTDKLEEALHEDVIKLNKLFISCWNCDIDQ
jgi:hypothetical protein